MVRRAAIAFPEEAPKPYRRRFEPGKVLPVLETAIGPAFLFIYLLTIFLPGVFSVGPLRLTLVKLILILAFVPLALRWITGHAGRITLPDLLFLGFCLWVAVATLVVHGTEQIFYVGSTFVEGFGAFLAGRVIVRKADDYARFFRYFLSILLIMLPFAVVEAVTRIRLLSLVVGTVLDTSTQYLYENRPRLGLTRVTAGFAHPILFGVVAGLGFANVYYIYRDRLLPQIRAVGLVVCMTFLSISSGPLLAILLQGAMIAWDRILSVLRSRWVLGIGLGLCMLLVLQLVLPGGLVGYIVNEIIFNPDGGQTRITAFQYGGAEVLRNPFFGIGLNDWARPYWEHSSIDNFWLVVAMRHGLPALALLVLAIAVSAAMIIRAELDERESRYRAGYLIALAGLVMALVTVHIWAGALVFVMTYFGIGVWFYARDAENEPRRQPHERRGSRREGRNNAPEGAVPAVPGPSSRHPSRQGAARHVRTRPLRGAKGGPGPAGGRVDGTGPAGPPAAKGPAGWPGGGTGTYRLGPGGTGGVQGPRSRGGDGKGKQ